VSSRALEDPSVDKPKWTDRDGRVKTGVKRSAKAVRASLKGDPEMGFVVPAAGIEPATY
jgi:hypothetical protein